MNNVGKLINYNLCAVKKSVFIAFGIFGVMWLITILTSFQFIALLPPACTAMVFEPVFINENKNNAKKLMGILPVKRYEYILSRYILLTVTAVVLAVISFGIIKISDNITLYDMAEVIRINSATGAENDITVSFAGLVLCVGLSLGAMHFFCHFVFPEDKANLATTSGIMISIIVIIAVLYFVSGNLETMLMKINELPQKMTENPYRFAGISALSGFAVDIVFCVLSVIIVNRKEI